VRLTTALVTIVAVISLSVAGFAAMGFTQTGPDETAALERGLFDLMGVYQLAIWPRQDILSAGVGSADLPKEYVQAVKASLEKVVGGAVKPVEFDSGEWLGLRKLRFERNFISGTFTSADGKCKAQFQATCDDMAITFASEELLSEDPGDMTTDRISALAKAFLNIPTEKVAMLKADGAVGSVAGTAVYHGVLRCDWVSDTESPIKERRWWSYMPYLYAKGKMLIDVSTHDWEKGPPSHRGDTWSF